MQSPSAANSLAPYWRRAAAHSVDTALGLALLLLIAWRLPVSPPPIDAMAFFRESDFRNYYTLVIIAVLVQALFALLCALPWPRGTPGQQLLRIRLVDAASSAPAGFRLVARRYWRALIGLLAICLPGPIIAMFAGAIAANVFGLEFTTTDQVLERAGFTPNGRMMIHSISFIALFVALWIYLIKPTLLGLWKGKAYVSLRDKWTGTRYHLRRSAA